MRSMAWLGGVALALAPGPLMLTAFSQKSTSGEAHLGGISAAPIFVYLLHALLWGLYALSSGTFIPVGLASGFGALGAIAFGYKLFSIADGFKAMQFKSGSVAVAVIVCIQLAFFGTQSLLLLTLATVVLCASPLVWLTAAYTPALMRSPVATLSDAMRSAADTSGVEGMRAEDLARKIMVMAAANLGGALIFFMYRMTEYLTLI